MNQLPFLIFIVVLVICRVGMMKARKVLSQEEKAKLLDIQSFSWQYIVYIVVFFGGLALINYEASIATSFIAKGGYLLSVSILLVIAVILGIWLRILRYIKMKQAGLPQTYLKPIMIYSSILYIFLFGFICSLFLQI